MEKIRKAIIDLINVEIEHSKKIMWGKYDVNSPATWRFKNEELMKILKELENERKDFN